MMPGGKICSVAICKNNSKKLKESGEKIPFFSFPNNPEICREWVRKCYRKDKFSTQNKRICGKHFQPQDFEDELKSRLLGTQPKLLKKTAIPSLLLLSLTSVPTTLSERSKRAEKKKRTQIVKDLLLEHVVNTEKVEVVIEEDIAIRLELQNDFNKQLILEKEIQLLHEENILLKNEVDKTEENYSSLKTNTVELEREFKIEDSTFEEKVKVEIDVTLKGSFHTNPRNRST